MAPGAFFLMYNSRHDIIGRRGSIPRRTVEPVVRGSRLQRLKFIMFNMEYKKRKLGMAPASIINFLSNEDTSRFVARFFIGCMRQRRYEKKTSISEKKLALYIPVIGFASAIVALITGVIVLINTCNSRSDTPPSVSQNVEVILNQEISPVVLVKDGKSDLPEPPSSLDKEKTAQTPPPPPSPEREYIKIPIPKRWGEKSPGSVFDRNVRIDLEEIKHGKARGEITVSGFEPRDFMLDKYSPPEEIGIYSVEVVETGNDYIEFCITRKER